MNVSRIKWHGVISLLGVILVPSAYAQTYFDELAARSDVVLAIPFRSQADVEEYWAPNNHDDVDYDAVVDSMRFRWPEAGGGNNIDGMRIPLPTPISTGKVFFTWEDRWSAEWASAGNRGDINGLGTFKNHHVKDELASGGLMLEVRKLHRKYRLSDDNIPAGKAGTVDIRGYYIPSGERGPGDGLPGGVLNDYTLEIETWTRYFLFVEYDNPGGEISLWITHPGQAPVEIYRQAGGSGGPGETVIFHFQHNSSDTYSGPTSYQWCRNLVILDGVSNLAEAQSLVAQGSMGGPPPVRPESPEWVPDP